MSDYVSKAVTKTISATSRASVKIQNKSGDSFFTIEFTEERTIPDVDGVDIVEERRLLWDTVNNEVDMQIEDIYKSFKTN